jgi:hypothetical protein
MSVAEVTAAVVTANGAEVAELHRLRSIHAAMRTIAATLHQALDLEDLMLEEPEFDLANCDPTDIARVLKVTEIDACNEYVTTALQHVPFTQFRTSHDLNLVLGALPVWLARDDLGDAAFSALHTAFRTSVASQSLRDRRYRKRWRAVAAALHSYMDRREDDRIRASGRELAVAIQQAAVL